MADQPRHSHEHRARHQHEREGAHRGHERHEAGQDSPHAEGRELRWYRSHNGIWCVCSEDDAAPLCACSLTKEGALRQLERARLRAE